MWFHKLSCMEYRYYTWCLAAQAIRNFAACLWGIPSFFEFCEALCTCKLGAVKYGEWVSHANQLQWTSILDYLDLHLFCTSENCFSPIFEDFELTIFCWIFKMPYVHMVSFCTVIGTSRARVPEVDNFSSGCYQALSPPHPFWEENLGMRLPRALPVGWFA